jgi:alkyl hydroperoxide reductase subunit AhpC
MAKAGTRDAHAPARRRSGRSRSRRKAVAVEIDPENAVSARSEKSGRNFSAVASRMPGRRSALPGEALDCPPNQPLRPPCRGRDERGRRPMTLQLGDVVPDFTAETTEGTIHFHDWLGSSWGVLFSHPKNFTPVCTTELGEVARLKPEFDRRGVKVIGLSVDAIADHGRWAADIAETQGHALNFPLIADADRTVANLYGMIHPNANDTLTVRSVFVVGPDKKLKLALTYPASTGRNFDEILRVIDSLQLTAKHQVATPVNWRDGDDVIIVPAVSDEAARAKYPDGWKAPKPYLRIVPQPGR